MNRRPLSTGRSSANSNWHPGDTAGAPADRRGRTSASPAAGPSPVQALAFALAGCMVMDVLAVLRRGRFALTGLTAHLVAERAPSDPKRIVKVNLRFTLAGQIPEHRVARAIQLSRERYCSVWHS